MKRSPMALRMIKRGLNAELDGQAGLMEFAGDATFDVFISWKKHKKVKNAFLEKRDLTLNSFRSSHKIYPQKISKGKMSI